MTEASCGVATDMDVPSEEIDGVCEVIMVKSIFVFEMASIKNLVQSNTAHKDFVEMVTVL